VSGKIIGIDIETGRAELYEYAM